MDGPVACAATAGTAAPGLEMWGGLECTVARIGTAYVDQTRLCRAVQIQATGAEEMPAIAAVAGRRSFPAKGQIV